MLKTLAILFALPMMINTGEPALTIRKMDVDTYDPVALEEAFNVLESEKIACCNWPDSSSYQPEVSFKSFHTGESFIIRYYVCEDCTTARAFRNNGTVWQDSCVEFFISPEKNMHYYNFEANSIGTMHIGHRVVPDTRTGVFAPDEVHSMIRRIPSMGKVPFDEITGNIRWTLTLIVPVKALFCDNINSWDGLEANMNFYKCGDALSKPHFLSWAPILTEEPAFHSPQFFKLVKFE